MDQHAIADLERAGEFGCNLMIIEHHSDAVWNEVIHNLATYDFSDKYRKTGDDRARAEYFRGRYHEIAAAAKRHNIPLYLQTSEPCIPPGFAPLDYDNPELWKLIHDRLVEVFRSLPDLTGVTVYLTEGQHEVEFIPGSEASKARRARKVIDTMWAACKQEHRKLMVGTFIHSLPMLEAISEALREFPPDPGFAVLQYCCPNDWGVYAVFNPSIGRVGPHPEIIGFDYNSENWGQSVQPFVHVDFIARQFREARRRSKNVAGIGGWTAWYGRRTLIGTYNEANVHAGAALAAHPDRDPADILNEWCAKRFGANAAPTAARCLARTHDVIFKAQHVFGYWVDTANKSGLPSIKEMDDYFIGDVFGEALGKWDPAYAATWQKIQNPDAAFLAELLNEKDQACSLARRNIEELTGAKADFRSEDYANLERALRFQELWTRIWREQMRAFFIREICRKQPAAWPAHRAAFDEALARLAQYAGEYDGFGPDWFPRNPQRLRENIDKLR